MFINLLLSALVSFKGIVVIANIQNNQDVSVNATVMIQVIDQYGFTESIGFQRGGISAHRAMSVGIKWVPQKPGKFVMDALAVDSNLRPLSDKSSSLAEIESRNASVKYRVRMKALAIFSPR